MIGAFEIEDAFAESLGEPLRLSHVQTMWEVGRLYADFLSAAARDLARDEAKVPTLRVLDFDVVCASLWHSIPSDHSRSSLDRLLGLPQSTYHFFRYTKRPFCLPWGAELEMNLWLRRRLAQNSQHSISRMEEALSDLVRPVQADGRSQTPPPQKALQALRIASDDLGRAANTVLGRAADLGQVRRVMKHEHHMPWRRIDAKRLGGVGALSGSVRFYFDQLQHMRANRDLNNIADAHNLAWYVSLTPGARSDFFPILASDTAVVRALDSTLAYYLPPSPEKALLNSQYLTFSTILEQYCEYDPVDPDPDATMRVRALIDSARDGLARVRDLQREVMDQVIRPRWLTESLDFRDDIEWKEFGGNFHFKEWARAYLNWRQGYLADVLKTFEYCCTTDDQLRRSFLQTVTSPEQCLLTALRDPQCFTRMISGHMRHSVLLAASAQLAGRLRLSLEVDARSATAAGGASANWQDRLAIAERGGERSSEGVVRTADSGELVMQVIRKRDGGWQFVWPTRFDLAEALRLLVGVVRQHENGRMRIFSGAEHEELDIRSLAAVTKPSQKPRGPGRRGKEGAQASREPASDRSSPQQAQKQDERIGSICRQLEGIGLDLLVEAAAAGTSFSYASQTGLFPEAQGACICADLEGVDGDVLHKVVSLYDISYRVPVGSSDLLAALTAVVSERHHPLKERANNG